MLAGLRKRSVIGFWIRSITQQQDPSANQYIGHRTGTFREFAYVDDLRGDKNAGRTLGVRGGDLDACGLVVALAAFKAKSATRNVLALNEAVFKARIADTRGKVHFDALMLASVLERHSPRGAPRKGMAWLEETRAASDKRAESETSTETFFHMVDVTQCLQSRRIAPWMA